MTTKRRKMNRNAPPPPPPLSSSPSLSPETTFSSPPKFRWPNLSEAENIELDNLCHKYLSDLSEDELTERNALWAHYELLSEAYRDMMDLPSWPLFELTNPVEVDFMLQKYRERDQEAGNEMRAWREGLSPREEILFNCVPFDEDSQAMYDEMADLINA